MTDIAPLPEWVAAIFAREDIQPRQAAPDTEIDLPYSIQEAQRWLNRQPLAAEGNASQTFYEQACQLKDMALSEPTIVAMLHARQPEYAEDDIGQRVANAFAYGQNEIGSDRPRDNLEVFANVEMPTPLEDVGFRSMAWLRLQNFDPITWLWDKLLPECKPAIITGDAKVGKTTFLLNLALHIAAGSPFLGAATKPSDVLLLLAEDEYGQVRDNLLSIRMTANIDPAALERLHIRSVLSDSVEHGHRLADIADSGSVVDTQFIREIVAPTIAQHPGCVLMIDPLVEFVRFNRYSEQAPRGLVRWMNSIARLGCTPLITDHPTIASMEQGRDIGGSKQMEASFPTVAALKAGKWEAGLTPQRPMIFELKYARYAMERKLDFWRQAGSPAFSLDGAPGTSPADRRNTVFRFIAEGLRMDDPPRYVTKTNSESSAWGGPKAVAQALMLSETAVKQALDELKMLRWLQNSERSGGGRGGHVPAHYEAGPEFNSPEARAVINQVDW